MDDLDRARQKRLDDIEAEYRARMMVKLRWSYARMVLLIVAYFAFIAWLFQ